ncbi:MAG: beta-lactamase family protein [Thermomicrobiales bacterium]|nr:beta-lactamase family protein [Thermomicrobiales bacterium]
MDDSRSGQHAAFSRRRALQAAGLAAATLATVGFNQTSTAAQEATPAADALPDLTGVTPLPLTGERLATFESYIAAQIAELNVPGIAVGVVQGDEVAFLQGFGVRELGRPEPVTADTLLRIGSVTKSFSSLLSATLVDARLLTWDTPLIDLLPAFAVEDAELTPKLTVGDAFCACSGLPRRDFEFILPANALTPERMIASMTTLPLTAPFGEKYQYNNQLVAAGGFAAAVADGGSPDALGHAYAIALRDRVLNPIGMPRTTYNLGEVVADGDYAAPHAVDLFGELHPVPLLMDDTWLVSVAPSGALWSSAGEMVRYVQTELRHGLAPDGGRVVSSENLEHTWQPGVALPAAPGTPAAMAAFAQHYGKGWVVGAYGGQRAIWHSGGTLGFSALVTFLPESELGVVVLTNGSGNAGQLIYAVVFRLLELLFDQPATMDAVVEANLARVASGREELLATLGQIDPAAVTPFVGQYANPDLGEMALQLRAGTLTFVSGPYRSAMLPQLAEDGTVSDYLLVDPPLSGFPPQMTFSFETDSAGQPQVILTAPADAGDPDLVYVYEPVAALATPAP